MGETVVISKREWTPMTLVSVGRVGDLMRGGTFSRPDGASGGGFDKGVGGTGPGGGSTPLGPPPL